MSEFVYNLIHNYKFVVSVATILALVVELAAPDLQTVVSQEFILGLLVAILGVGSSEKYLYQPVQNYRE